MYITRIKIPVVLADARDTRVLGYKPSNTANTWQTL